MIEKIFTKIQKLAFNTYVYFLKKRASYGQLPIQLVNYEKLYDKKTGGWYNFYTKGPSFGSVELEVGRFYYAFVQMLQPKMVLETGVFNGYSTACIAAALKDLNNGGHIFGIDPAHIHHLWEKTDLKSLITWIPTLSQEAVSFIEGKIFDLLVLDSDHSYKTIMWELIHFEKYLKVGGHILMHDSLYFDGVGAAVKQLYRNPRFEVITLNSPRTHGNDTRCPGVTIVRKIAEGHPALEYEQEFDDWVIGDASTTPYLRDIQHTTISTN
ncbi:class I SAM-dependent methyltransferase [Scytonema sp. NUACC26]|uniref:class I SAM-dependent methyltransferase n=1 Tax=Scytonema sp. NUACC26 TaxID=3140176 RepID=UPI0034DC2ED9